MVKWLGGALLNILAALGLVCIVLVILSFVFNVSIMMFKTGSMSPTIEAGSISFVHEIPAEEMKVGDIITVDRGEGVLPVTHRVTSISDTESRSGQVTFEMKGDANEAKDPEPYAADTVRKVMVSVPGIAPVIQQFRSPCVLGGITIAASLLVVWAFWPRREKHEVDELAEEETDRTTAAEVSAHVTDQAGASRSPRHAFVLPAVVVLLAVNSGSITSSGAPTPLAAAADDTTNITAEVRGQYLQMRAVGDESKMLNLSPGASAAWTVDVWAEAPEPGTVELEIGSGKLSDELASELVVDVQTCARIVPMQQCPGGAAHLIRQIPLNDLGAAPDNDRPLLEMPSDQKRRVQVTVTMAKSANAEAVAGQRSGVRLTAIGQGEEVSLGPGDPGDPDDPNSPDPDVPGDLPRTGIDGWQWLLLAAVVLIAVGSALVVRARHRRMS